MTSIRNSLIRKFFSWLLLDSLATKKSFFQKTSPKSPWSHISLKQTPNERFFEKLYATIFIYSQSFYQKSAERKPLQKYVSIFRFDIWPGVWSVAFMSNKPTRYLLQYGDLYIKTKLGQIKLKNCIITDMMLSCSVSALHIKKLERVLHKILRSSNVLFKNLKRYIDKDFWSFIIIFPIRDTQFFINVSDSYSWMNIWCLFDLK